MISFIRRNPVYRSRRPVARRTRSDYGDSTDAAEQSLQRGRLGSLLGQRGERRVPPLQAGNEPRPRFGEFLATR